MLFTCLSTRAVHLESTDNLTTNNCITAIRRFIARRGTPKLLISDNATYFVGARKQLRSEPINFNETTLTETLQIHNVEWRLNPPAAPHFGRVWERLVSLIKRAFLLNFGSDRLSRDLFATIVAETEAILNSRPLTHVSSYLDDDLPLTPNHFLMGRPFVYAPAAAFYEASKSKLSNKSWKRAKDRLDSFWRRLLKEYVPTLIKRTKWTQPEETLEKDDLVWILEDFTPRGIWPLGRVLEVFTGSDGIARSCKLKTALGTLTRPAVKLALVTPKKKI